MRRLARNAAVAIASISVAGAAFANDSYLLVRGGAFLPQGGGLRAFSSLPTGEAAAGRWIRPFLACEISAGYYGGEGEVTVRRVPGGIDYEQVDLVERVDVIPVDASVKLAFPSGPLRPYAILGAGIHFGTFERDPVQVGAAIASEADAFLAYHVGAGAVLDLDRDLFAALDGRWTFGNARAFEEWIRVEGVRASLALGLRF